MEPIKKEALDATSQVCFLCQESSNVISDGLETEIEFEMKLLSSRMPHSKAMILSKIENILGKNFSILVENDEVICESCFKILVRIDKMEMVIKTFLSVKYNLDIEDKSLLLRGDNEDPLELDEANDEVDTFYVVKAHNDTLDDCRTPKNIEEEHNYYSLTNLNDTEQDEYRNATLVETESGPTKDDDAFDNLPDSSKIEPIDMTQHELDISDTNNGSFKCAKCMLTFTCIASLRRHLVLHSGMPESCRICLKLAPDKIFLKIHVRQVHMKKVDTLKRSGWTKPLALTCPKCPYQASEVQLLVRHINNMHNRSRVPDKRTRYLINKKHSEENGVDKSNLQEENADHWSESGQFGTELTGEVNVVSYLEPKKGRKSRIISQSPKLSLTNNSKEVDECCDLTQEKCQMEKRTSLEGNITWVALVTPKTESLCNQIAPSATQTSVAWDSNDSGRNVLSEFLTGQDMPECPKCCNRFVNKENLGHHMKGHDSKPVTCCVCDVVLEDRVLHKQHMWRVHKEGAEEELAAFQVEGGFRCSECGRVVNNPANFQAHMRLHRDKLSLQCSLCLEVMPDRESLQTHWCTPHPQEAQNEDFPEVLSCSVCSKEVTSLQAFRRHMAGHDPSTGPLKCGVCGMQLQDRLHRRIHMVQVHPGRARHPFSCSQCTEMFRSKASIERHITRKHTELKCGVCGKMFKDIRPLRQHEQNHKLTGPGPIPCPVCPKSWASQKAMRRHLKSHNAVKPHLCAVCGKSFSTSNGLEEHMGLHGMADRYTCEICGRTFMYKSSMRMHRKWHDNPHPYACPHESCGRRYKTHSHLKAHRRTAHSTERPFKCTFCPKTFNNRVTFKQHEMGHTGLYSHNCEHCDYGTGRLKYLLTHYLRAHGDEARVAELKPKKCTYKLSLRPEEMDKSDEAVAERETLLAVDELLTGDAGCGI